MTTSPARSEVLPFDAKRVAKNALYILTSQAVLLGLGLVAGGLVFKRLGADTLGLIYFVSTTTAVLASMAQLGIGATVTREVAIRRREIAQVSDVLRPASLLAWAVYSLLCGLLWLSAPLITGQWLKLTTLTNGDATWGLRILGTTALLCVPRALYVGILQGLQQIGLSSFLESLSNAIQQGALVFALLHGSGIRDVIALLAATNVATLALHMVACATAVSPGALVPGWKSGAVNHPIEFLRAMTGISVTGLIHGYLPRVAISGLLPLGATGQFGLISTVTARAGALGDAIAQAAFPALSAPTGVAHPDTRYTALGATACMGTLPILAAIAILAYPTLSLVFDPRVAASLILPTAVLCIGAYARVIILIPYYASLAMGRPRPALQANIELLPIMIPLTVVLVYAWGILGAALAVLSYQVLVAIRFIPRVAHVMHVRSSTLIKSALKMLAIAVLSYAVPAAITLFDSSRTVTAVCGVLVGTALFTLVLYLQGELAAISRVAGWSVLASVDTTDTPRRRI